MIVYAASDLHGNLPQVPADADLLLLAGDICPDFGPSPKHHYEVVDTTGVRQAEWLDTEFRQWLRDAPCSVVATWGNHDFVGEKYALVDSLHLPWTLLLDQPINTHGLRIYGTPWVPNLPRWAFNASDEALAIRAEGIPYRLDILMTHGPPRGIGDFIPGGSKYGNVGEEHVGDPSLNEAINRARPRFVVCGHIHEARGTYNIAFAPIPAAIGENDSIPPSVPFFQQDCTVMNVAAVDGFYDLYDHPFSRIYGL